MSKHSFHRVILTAALLVTTAGCEPRLSDDELGEKLDTLPAIEGVEEPYPFPEFEDLDEPPADSPNPESPGPQLPTPTVGVPE